MGFFDLETCEDFIKKKGGFMVVDEENGGRKLVLSNHDAHIQRVPWDLMMEGGFCGVRRRCQSRLDGFKDRLQRGVEVWQTEIESACGEIAVGRFTGLDWECSVGKLKRGGDVGNWTQVRWSINNTSELIIRPADEKMIRKPWVLVTGCLGWYLIHGWLWGYEAKEKKEDGRFRWGAWEDSPNPAWAVPQEYLHPMNTLPTEPSHEVGEEVIEEDVS